MTEIIELLEQMGQNASLQNEDAIEKLMNASAVDSEIKDLIIKKDALALAQNLDVCPDIVCLLVPAEDEEEEKEGETEEQTEQSVTDNIKWVVNL